MERLKLRIAFWTGLAFIAGAGLGYFIAAAEAAARVLEGLK